MCAFQLSSPAFDDGETIPRRFGFGARNVNPPLRIDGVPDGTESLVVLMDDPDAVEPAGKIWDHWVVYDVPPDVREIPEDWDGEGTEGTNDFGEVGYGGPNPPDRRHTYRFRCFALDSELDLPRGQRKADVEDALDGTVLEEATLTGTYAP